MTIHFIDVGQADAFFIDYGEYEILIDGGNRKDGKTVIDYIRPLVDGPIELVIATHMDSDHIGGLIDVVKEFDINKIIWNGEEKDNDTIKAFKNAAAKAKEFVVMKDEVITICPLSSIQIIAPIEYYNSNEHSIVSVLTYDEVKVLFTGDMETRSERDLLDRFTKVDVLKSSHHGSRTSSNMSFLNITQPDYVIISCALKNSYGHPHYAALQRYLDTGATVYGTFKDGTIVMTTDGKTYNIDATNIVTLADAGDRKDNTAKDSLIENQNGTVYIGNISTKRLHYPGCDSVTQMTERNRVEFSSISEAAGYNPCGICRPQ